MDSRRDADSDVLVRLAIGGDSDALGRLLQHYCAYLTLLARLQIGRRLQSTADASDVVQDAFLEVHRTFEQFRGNTPAELTAWQPKKPTPRPVSWRVKRICPSLFLDLQVFLY